jgi:hypothetical protein
MEDFLSQYEALKKAHQEETLKLLAAHQAVTGQDPEMLSSRQISLDQLNYYSAEGLQKLASEHRLAQHQASYLSSAIALEEAHRNALLALSNEVAEYQLALRRMQMELVLSLASSVAKITKLKNEADEVGQKAMTLSHSMHEIGTSVKRSNSLISPV